MRVVVVNAGSSSLKLSLLRLDAGEPEREPLLERVVERWAGEEDTGALEEFLAAAGPVDRVAHRVVHGGPALCGPVAIDDEVLSYLSWVGQLAPLHQPRAVAGIRLARRLRPEVAHVAVFDTAFHTTLPAEASTYALPAAWNRRWGLRRYGFHGLSHAAASRRAADLVGRPPEGLRMVICHLGAGSSLCAVREGRSVDTTMGFTPLEGLVMQTRSGSVDPGLVLWLLEHGGVAPGDLHDALERHAGLAGLSGTSGDMRDVRAVCAEGHQDAALAMDVFMHRLAGEVGAMAVAAGGLDVLVLTGGIGEHDPLLRADLAHRLALLGVVISPWRNDAVDGDADISAPGSTVRTLVLSAREDLEAAREAATVPCRPGDAARSASGAGH